MIVLRMNRRISAGSFYEIFEYGKVKNKKMKNFAI